MNYKQNKFALIALFIFAAAMFVQPLSVFHEHENSPDHAFEQDCHLCLQSASIGTALIGEGGLDIPESVDAWESWEKPVHQTSITPSFYQSRAPPALS